MQALREVPKPAPKRLSHSELLVMNHEERMAQASRPAHDSESVEISRNARGQFQFGVTARTAVGETLEDAFERASAVIGQCVARFPYTENGGS